MPGLRPVVLHGDSPAPLTVQIVDEVVALAGPGGPHADTLLLVWGDHGQTDSGDHGGGSPPEVRRPMHAGSSPRRCTCRRWQARAAVHLQRCMQCFMSARVLMADLYSIHTCLASDRQQIGRQQVDSVLVAVDVAALHARRHGSGGGIPAKPAPESAGAAGASGGTGRVAHPGSTDDQAWPTASAWPTMPQVFLLLLYPCSISVPPAKHRLQRSNELFSCARKAESAGIIPVHHTNPHNVADAVSHGGDIATG